MAFSNIDYPTLSRDKVLALIREAGYIGDQFKAYRVKNDAVIATFTSINDALAFIDSRDYDTAKVKVRSVLGSEDVRRLGAFDNECTQDVPGWIEGATVTRADVIDAEFARRRALAKLPGLLGTDIRWLYDAIPFSMAAENLRNGAARNGQYATIDGTRYYFV